ncbi:MAG: hypothetical protein IRZ08_11565 [Frankia sp.]|nr:hypothetical protein [Frankia sp.]
MAKIKIGKPDVAIDAPAHIRGVPQGNVRAVYSKQPGHHPDGTADARRSTGIKAAHLDPVLDSMPNLPPG